MVKYLGEFEVNLKNTPFVNYDKVDWMMYFLENYGSAYGDHHKLWVLDQMARVYNDTSVNVKLAKWDINGKKHEEYRITLDKPSNKYKTWVKEMKNGEDGPETYFYDEGVAP